MMLPVKYFTNDEISEILSVPECIEIVEDLFKNIEQTQMPPKVYMDIPNGDFRANRHTRYEQNGVASI